MERINRFLLVFCLIAAIVYPISASSIDPPTNEELFDIARKQLAKREIEEALLTLRKLYVQDRNNANINFLIGAAYTEMTASSDKAIYHLKKALKQVSENYRVGDFSERNAPIHCYYYLTVALSARDDCAKAAAASEKLKQYNSIIDLYFIDEAQRHMQKCPYESIDKTFDKWLTINEVPENYVPDSLPVDTAVQILEQPVEMPLANLDSLRKRQMGVVTRELEYSTSAPLFGVQIGSNSKPSPISSYSKLKNVDVFIDKDGMIRYVVGHFSYRKQAENLLEKLKNEGYPDAFVVNVNHERKYSNELISFGNVNLKAGIRGEVEYYVQLGAFNDSVPEYLMQMYLTVDDLKELSYRGMTLIAVGSYTTYKQSVKKKEELQELQIEGIEKAFIVAFNKGDKITLQEAIDYTD